MIKHITGEVVNKSSLSILACDDCEIIRVALQAILSELSHCTVVENGKAAIDEALTGRYQILIIDIHMPEIDGFEVAKQVKAYAKENNKKILVYAHTAEEEKEVMRQCEGSSFDGLLLKPLDVEALKTIIAENFGN